MTVPVRHGKHDVTPRSTFTHIGNWTLGDTLGRGAYAHVRRAKHISGREAACKILPALHQDPTKPATWDQTVDAIEAHKEVVLLRALSGIKVTGVNELEGIVERDGWTYMFTSLHPHSAAQENEPWEHDRLVNFFRRLCLTVHSLHQLNISHEDIKRSNTLVDVISCPALIDFGFSHFAAYGQKMKSAGGTLDYSSPEKVRDRAYDGPTTDVWSLGILLTKMLAIPHPFIDIERDTLSTAKAKIIDASPEYHFSPEHLGRGKAASLILQMLESDPTKRITLSEVLDHPFLMPTRLDPHPFIPPPFRLPSKIRNLISPAVIMDVCFLAYLNKDLVLCETFRHVEERIFGPEPCWEQRWATMLYQWKEREDMDWEDIAVFTKQPIARPARPSQPLATVIGGRGILGQKRTALKEIYLDSQVNRGVLPGRTPTNTAKHVHQDSSALEPKKMARTQAAQEPGQGVAEMAKKPGLGRKITQLPSSQDLAAIDRIHAVTPRQTAVRTEHIAARPARIGRVRRPTRAKPNLLSAASNDIGYPVLKPAEPSAMTDEFILLDSPPRARETAEAVDGMAGAPARDPAAGPRRSSRIAAKGARAKGLR